MNLKPLPAYGDLFTLEEFVEMAQRRVVTDCDGTGYFAEHNGMSDIEARPSTLEHGFPMRHTGTFTHVMWFNK